MSTPEYDLAILGAGASGLIAADFAIQLGARTALLDKGPIGGDCTWTGCVPSKSLIKVASVAHLARIGERYGILNSAPSVDMPRARDYLRRTIQQIYAPTTPEALREKGLHVYIGTSRFLNERTLQIGNDAIRARKTLINTGAQPRVPSISGLNDVPYSTYLNIFDNDGLPAHLIVIGGGPIGCEIAQAYRRLGSQVTIIAERLIPREDAEVSQLLEVIFAEEGIQRIPARAELVRKEQEMITVDTNAGEVAGDLLFVATGRAPVVKELGLERAGVRYSERGIAVDKYLRTSVRNIYAAGDVISGPQFSHLAGWQGFQAVRNALLPGNNAGFSEAMPRVTFTTPEIAQVGVSEETARQRYRRDQLQIMTFDINKVDRAVNEDDRRGLIKIVARTNGVILGATIVGERAGEAITEIAVAMRHKLKLSALASTIHPYPTYSTGIQLLSTRMAVERAFSGSSGKIIRGLSSLWR